jgi:hypothetical protein
MLLVQNGIAEILKQNLSRQRPGKMSKASPFRSVMDLRRSYPGFLVKDNRASHVLPFQKAQGGIYELPLGACLSSISVFPGFIFFSSFKIADIHSSARHFTLFSAIHRKLPWD